MTGLLKNRPDALQANFMRARPSPRRAGWVMLALALAFAADAGLSYVRAREARLDKQQRAAGFARSAGLSTEAALAARAASPEELAVAADTVRRLSLSWDSLFAALEGAATDRVTLTAIEPDAKARTVTLTGEGRDYDAALGYVQRLKQSPALERVHLVRHEVRRDDPAKPGALSAVAFSISAAWKDIKPEPTPAKARSKPVAAGGARTEAKS